MSRLLFKVRPATLKAKDGPFQATVSEAQLAQLGGRNGVTAWITGQRAVQVLLWREVVQKGPGQTGVGKVVLLSEEVRQLAGVTLGDEVSLHIDGDQPPVVRQIVLTSAAYKSVLAHSQSEKEDLHVLGYDALCSSIYVACGQVITVNSGTEATLWQIHKINDSEASGLYKMGGEPNVRLSPPLPIPAMQLKEDRVFGVEEVIEKINGVLRTFEEKRVEPWSETYPGLFNILVTGQAGCGKTLLLDEIAKLSWPKVFRIEAGISKEAMSVQSILEQASQFSRALVLIDDIHLAKDEKNLHSGFAYRLQKAMRQAREHQSSRILLLATARSTEALDPLLMERKGFKYTYRLRLPKTNARESILHRAFEKEFSLMKSLNSAERDSELKLITELARRTPSYSGEDLLGLRDQTVLDHRQLQYTRKQGEQPASRLECALKALEIVRPSTMQGVHVEVPNTKFSDIGGQEELKRFLAKQVRDALVDPASLARVALKPAKGLLMYGPPGCSKTLVAKAIATEFNFNFLLVNAGELIKSYVGESETQIRELFQRARDASPCVIFFDEFEALGGDRDASLKGLNTTQTLLTELDGVKLLEGVFVLAATNIPEAIDAALLREGRLKPFMVGLPDEEARREIVKIEHRQLEPSLVGDISDQSLVDATDGCTGAEVVAFLQEARREWHNDTGDDFDLPLMQRHFDAAKPRIRRTVDAEKLQRYHDWAERNERQ